MAEKVLHDALACIDKIASGTGLDSLGSVGCLLIGVVLLYAVLKIFSLPFKLLYNGIVGALMLWLMNFVGGFVGFGMEITLTRALIAGFFGIPGALALLLFEIYSRF